jgi:single-strand DNA-binding protein
LKKISLVLNKIKEEMVNKVQLIGRLGKDPEIRTFEGNNKIANFTLATNERYKDKTGNMVDVTDWHNVVVRFTKQAEIAEKYLKKGMLVYIEGKLKNHSWDDKDGNKKYITEVVVDSFNMLEKQDVSMTLPPTESNKKIVDTPTTTPEETTPESKSETDGLPF